MNLDEAQIAKVRQWIEQGLKAADVQTRLMDELGLKLTYAEVRFLLGDLQLRPKDPPPPPKPAESTLVAAPNATGPAGSSRPAPGVPASPGLPGSPASPAGAPLKTAPLGPDTAAPGGVSVSVDEIARPTMVVSGKVTFGDGQKADWGIDQMGRPMLIPVQQGYRPSATDIAEFQTQLEQVLSRFGY